VDGGDGDGDGGNGGVGEGSNGSVCGDGNGDGGDDETGVGQFGAGNWLGVGGVGNVDLRGMDRGICFVARMGGGHEGE